MDRQSQGRAECRRGRPKAGAGAFMNSVQNASGVFWTEFMNAPAPAFSLLLAEIAGKVVETGGMLMGAASLLVEIPGA